MAALQRDPKDPGVYALANAVGAATVAQLKSKPLKNGAEIVTRESMEGEVQRVRGLNPLKVRSFPRAWGWIGVVELESGGKHAAGLI